MNNRKALITGINGQDGSYLAELLLDKGYHVIGVERRTSGSSEDKYRNLSTIISHPNLVLEQGDISDFSSVYTIVQKHHPDEIYNLAAQSHVGTSFGTPISTFEINTIGCLNLLESIRLLDKNIRFYQASTSEMFGDNTDTPQHEETLFSPVSPYACAKLASHHLVDIYRKSYGIYSCSGILFNHESPRRGEDFVTRKITKAAARIKLGLQSELLLGNIDSYRDWGFAGDYVKAMWSMLQQSTPSDYVIATGKTTTVREFLNSVFNYAGLDVDKYVRIDPNLFRPCEVPRLWGDYSKAKQELGWEPTTTVEELARIMFEEDYRLASKGK